MPFGRALTTSLLLTSLLIAACGGDSGQIALGATCIDRIKNAQESGVDCGGPLCGPCGIGGGCALPSDCASGVCEGGACGCPPGFVADGVGGCEDIDDCPVGYVPDGAGGCDDIDECDLGEDACADEATCTNTRGAYTCQCAPGYQGDGRACAPCAAGSWGLGCANACLVESCARGPTCDAVTGQATGCGECDAGRYGVTCQTACAVGACVGDVTCDQGTGLATACEGCGAGYYGATCELGCPVGNCLGEVTCAQETGVATSCASCQPGFFGPACASRCEAGECQGVMSCDQVSGEARSCDGQCAPGSFGVACAERCSWDTCIACSSTGTCASGSTCVEGFCLGEEGSACADNRECLAVCIDGLCARPSVTFGPCDEAVDCVTGHACVEGMCLRSVGTSCDDNELCVGTCFMGACRLPVGTGGQCEEPEDCVEGHVCANGVCRRDVGQTCDSNDQCSRVCVGGVCAQPSGTGGPCDERPDCAAAHACVEGVCLRESGQVCGLNVECVGVCVLGACRAPSGYNGACDEDTDCGPGLACGDARLCKLADGGVCSANAECDATCIGGVCGPRSGTFGACEERADCVAAHECVAGVCVRDNGGTCVINAQCAGVCIAQVCGPRSGVGGPCDDIGDCAAGYSCIGGSCLFDEGASCADNSQCVDVCIDLVCRPASGTGGPCDETADCAPNHACVNDVCRSVDGEVCQDNTSCVGVCIDESCAPVSTFDGPCDETADCAAGLVCNDLGLCKRPEGGQCSADIECATPNTACVGQACVTDATPAGFVLFEVGCQVPSSVVTSNTVTASGFYGPLPLSVAGDGAPQLVVNNVAGGQTATVRAGDTFAVQVTAPAATQGATTVTATLGPQSQPWTVRSAPNLTPGQVIKSEQDVIKGQTRNATGQVFTVPETAVYAVHTYMLCRDRIHYGEYEYTWCTAYLERQNADGSWAAIVGHSHHNGQCCTQQSYVTDRSTDTSLSSGVNYRFRYVAQPRTTAATTVYGSAADVKFKTCQ